MAAPLPWITPWILRCSYYLCGMEPWLYMMHQTLQCTHWFCNGKDTRGNALFALKPGGHTLYISPDRSSITFWSKPLPAWLRTCAENWGLFYHTALHLSKADRHQRLHGLYLVDPWCAVYYVQATVVCVGVPALSNCSTRRFLRDGRSSSSKTIYVPNKNVLFHLVWSEKCQSL